MPLEVRGSLHLESGRGHSLTLASHGDRLRVDVPSWKDAREAIRSLPSRAGRGRPLQGLHRALCATALQVDVVLKRRVVASIGPWARPGLLARALGLAPAAIYPWAALASLFSSER